MDHSNCEYQKHQRVAMAPDGKLVRYYDNEKLPEGYSIPDVNPNTYYDEDGHLKMTYWTIRQLSEVLGHFPERFTDYVIRKSRSNLVAAVEDSHAKLEQDYGLNIQMYELAKFKAKKKLKFFFWWGRQKTDLERFVDLYRSFGIEPRMFNPIDESAWMQDDERSWCCMLIAHPWLPGTIPTQDERFLGRKGSGTTLYFDAAGKFVKQEFFDGKYDF